MAKGFSLSLKVPETFPLPPIPPLILHWPFLDPGRYIRVLLKEIHLLLPSPGEKFSSCPTGISLVHVTTCFGLLLGRAHIIPKSDFEITQVASSANEVLADVMEAEA